MPVRHCVPSPGGCPSLVLGTMTVQRELLSDVTAAPRQLGAERRRVTIRTRRRQLRSTFVWALCLAALVLVSSLVTAVFRETPDHVIAALVVLRVRRRRAQVSCSTPRRERPLGGAPRPAHRPSEPRAARRPHRAGDSAVAALGRAVHADRGRPRRVQGRERRPRAPRRRHRAEDTRSALRSGHPRDGHRRPRRRRRVRRALDGHGKRRTARRARRPPPPRVPRPFRVEGDVVEIDGSIGWSVFPDDGSTAEELLARADGQMYATKRDTSDESVLLRRGVDAGIVRDVEAALEQNELAGRLPADHRPRDREPQSAEALIRRVLPDGGLVQPSEFVPHVERTPLVRELTFLVVADALTPRRSGRRRGHDLGVSINIPYRLLDDPQFVDGSGGRCCAPTSCPRRGSRSRSSPPAPAPACRSTRRRSSIRCARRPALAGRCRPRRLVRRVARPPARRAEDRRRVRPRAREERHRRGARPRHDRHRPRARPEGRRRGRRDARTRGNPHRLGLRLRAGVLRREPAPAEELVEWLGAAAGPPSPE